MRICWATALILTICAFFPAGAAAGSGFDDMPPGHWAHDAVEQLYSRGVVAGYPEGAYDGWRFATRYEAASVVACLLARADVSGASERDIELMRKLAAEFRHELAELGEGADKLGERLGAFEKNLGGWRLSGQFRMYAEYGGNGDHSYHGFTGDAEFNIDRYRLFLTKRVSGDTSFTSRLGRDRTPGADGGFSVQWERCFITTKLPGDISLVVGRNQVSWEDELDLYDDKIIIGVEAFVGAITSDMLMLGKDFGAARARLIIGEPLAGGPPAGATAAAPGSDEKHYVAALADFDFGERASAGIMGYYFRYDDEPPGMDMNNLTLGIYAKYRLLPGVEIKGLYYLQTYGDYWRRRGTGTVSDGDAEIWKAVLDIKQDVLKFTDLWLEYARFDNNFYRGDAAPASSRAYAYMGADIMSNLPFNDGATELWALRAMRRWNDRLETYIRYATADFNSPGCDRAFNWTFGVRYQLNRAVNFELNYDSIDYGQGANQARRGDDQIVTFCTFVMF